MTTYTVQTGDTYESIARTQFGTSDRGASIIAANPGAPPEPLPGAVLVISKFERPTVPPGVEPGELSVAINGERYIGWETISFTRSMDSFGTFSLTSVWEPDNQSFRDAFRPFGYQAVSVFEGDELLFNGTMIEVAPVNTVEGRRVSARGYSLPGVLNDCTPPISALPLEGDDLNLQQVAEALLTPFGLPVEFEGDAGPAFQREAIAPTEKVLQYLIKLAQQRQLIITDTPEGACRFQTEAASGSPVAVLREGQSGITAIEPQFNPQEYYSHISGQGFTIFSAPVALAGGAFTAPNPRLQGVLRPLTFSVPDAIGGELTAAVDAKIGRMFANAAMYSATVPSWRDPGDNLWVPNTTISIDSPGAMIYGDYEFLIRSVDYTRTDKAEVAVLGLTLPGVFKGEVPEVLPWEE